VSARRRRARADRGETLIELVLSIVLMGSAGLVFVGTLAAAMLHSDRTKGHTEAANLLASVSALADTDSLPFVPCAQPADYQSAVSVLDKDEYKLTVDKVVGWNGSDFVEGAACDPNTQGLQRITVSAAAPRGVVHRVVITKSRTAQGGVALQGASTSPSQQGAFALSVDAAQSGPQPSAAAAVGIVFPKQPIIPKITDSMNHFTS